MLPMAFLFLAVGKAGGTEIDPRLMEGVTNGDRHEKTGNR